MLLKGSKFWIFIFVGLLLFSTDARSEDSHVITKSKLLLETLLGTDSSDAKNQNLPIFSESYGSSNESEIIEQLVVEIFEKSNTPDYELILKIIADKSDELSASIKDPKDLKAHSPLARIYDLSLALQNKWNRQFGDELQKQATQSLKTGEQIGFWSSISLNTLFAVATKYPALTPKYLKIIRTLWFTLPVVTSAAPVVVSSIQTSLRNSNTPVPPATIIKFGIPNNDFSPEDFEKITEVYSNVLSTMAGSTVVAGTSTLLGAGTVSAATGTAATVTTGAAATGAAGVGATVASAIPPVLLTIGIFIAVDQIFDSQVRPRISEYRANELRDAMYAAAAHLKVALDSNNAEKILSAVDQYTLKAFIYSDLLQFQRRSKIQEAHLHFLNLAKNARRSERFQNALTSFKELIRSNYYAQAKKRSARYQILKPWNDLRVQILISKSEKFNIEQWFKNNEESSQLFTEFTQLLVSKSRSTSFDTSDEIESIFSDFKSFIDSSDELEARWTKLKSDQTLSVDIILQIGNLFRIYVEKVQKSEDLQLRELVFQKSVDPSLRQTASKTHPDEPLTELSATLRSIEIPLMNYLSEKADERIEINTNERNDAIEAAKGALR